MINKYIDKLELINEIITNGDEILTNDKIEIIRLILEM